MIKSQITLSRIFNQDERTGLLCRWEQASLMSFFSAPFAITLPQLCMHSSLVITMTLILNLAERKWRWQAYLLPLGQECLR